MLEIYYLYINEFESRSYSNYTAKICQTVGGISNLVLSVIVLSYWTTFCSVINDHKFDKWIRICGQSLRGGSYSVFKLNSLWSFDKKANETAIIFFATRFKMRTMGGFVYLKGTLREASLFKTGRRQWGTWGHSIRLESFHPKAPPISSSDLRLDILGHHQCK